METIQRVLGNNGVLSALLVSATLGLTACGGGGSSSGGGSGGQGGSPGTDFSNVGPATVQSDEDAAEVADAATEGVFRGINSENASDTLPIAGIVSEYDLRDALADDARIIAEAAQSMSEMPVGIETSIPGDCGGSVSFDPGQISIGDGSSTLNYNYNSYCLELGDGSQYIIDGTASYTSITQGGELTEYTVSYDLTYRITGSDPVVSQVTGTTTCTFVAETINCSYADDFTGPNGESYRIENVSVSRNSGSGTYDVSARVYDTDVGFVEFSASDIGQCADGNFNSGTISITDSTGTVVVEVLFTNCNDCVVTFNGVSQTYPQPDRG